jgi:beta-phosphoglucomutase-like phosphatase (HAD superfamily)
MKNFHNKHSTNLAKNLSLNRITTLELQKNERFIKNLPILKNMTLKNPHKENERRVIQIRKNEQDLDIDTIDGIIKSTEEACWKIGMKLTYSSSNNIVTYIFNTVPEANFFGESLDRKDVAFSYNPARDYNRLAGLTDNNFFNSFVRH